MGLSVEAPGRDNDSIMGSHYFLGEWYQAGKVRAYSGSALVVESAGGREDVVVVDPTSKTMTLVSPGSVPGGTRVPTKAALRKAGFFVERETRIRIDQEIPPGSPAEEAGALKDAVAIAVDRGWPSLDCQDLAARDDVRSVGKEWAASAFPEAQAP